MSMSVAQEHVALLQAFSRSLRAGWNLRSILCHFPSEEVPPSMRAAVASMERRARLGADIGSSLQPIAGELGADGRAVVILCHLHARLGGNLALALESLARWIIQRQQLDDEARTHAAGARLSARMVSGLPLAFLLLAPVARAPLLDAAGLLTLVCGVALAIAGLRWIERLVPQADREPDRGALLATLLASATGAGIHPSAALTAMADEDEAGHLGLARAARLARLGLAWEDALARSEDPGVRAVGERLWGSARTGTPAASLLEDLVAERALARRRELEEAIRRAPVRMVLPLTLCVLPSFLLLGLAPFLRGLRFG